MPIRELLLMVLLIVVGHVAVHLGEASIDPHLRQWSDIHDRLERERELTRSPLHAGFAELLLRRQEEDDEE